MASSLSPDQEVINLNILLAWDLSGHQLQGDGLWPYQSLPSQLKDKGTSYSLFWHWPPQLYCCLSMPPDDPPNNLVRQPKSMVLTSRMLKNSQTFSCQHATAGIGNLLHVCVCTYAERERERETSFSGLGIPTNLSLSWQAGQTSFVGWIWPTGGGLPTPVLVLTT